MKILIEEDVFEISKRLKEIDDGYFLVYDTKKSMYEVHNKYQSNTYCLSISGNLDSNVIDVVLRTNILNIDNILREVDKNNAECVNKQNVSYNDYVDFRLREIYSFANNSSKSLSLEINEKVWY